MNHGNFNYVSIFTGCQAYYKQINRHQIGSSAHWWCGFLCDTLDRLYTKTLNSAQKQLPDLILRRTWPRQLNRTKIVISSKSFRAIAFCWSHWTDNSAVYIWERFRQKQRQRGLFCFCRQVSVIGGSAWILQPIQWVSLARTLSTRCSGVQITHCHQHHLYHELIKLADIFFA